MTVARVVVYTKYYCVFCNRAKALLRAKNVEFREVDITDDVKLQGEVRRRSGRMTVPQIFVDEKPIGGYDELRRLDESGELDRLLA
jgi:GrxC family glutaredoxin